MRRCRKCIMPEIYPGISFDNEGICNFCAGYRPYRKYTGRDKLIEALNSATKTGEHDCVIPISGGKDSTFILYYAVRELEMKPIAVTYSSGYQTEIAKENMRNACEILGAPLVVVKSSGNIQSKLLGESLLISEKVGYLTYYCGNCEAIIRTVSMNTAKTYGVPYVLWGSSALETLSNQNYEHYRRIGKNRRANLPSLLSKIRSKINVVLRNPQKIRQIPERIYPYVGYHSIKYDIFSILQRLKLNFPIKYALAPHSIPPFTENNPKFIHFFDYIVWDSIRNIKILKDQLNWKHPIDRQSRFDCSIHCFANYEYLKSYGISHDGVNFCNFIRENRMDREAAMARENTIKRLVNTECEEMIARIGLENYKMP